MRSAPGGKITEAEYEAIVREGAQCRAAKGLSARHVQRILKGEAWAEGWLPRKVENDVKLCRICGAEFLRRFKCGRLRSDELWDRKRTCGSSCANKLSWREGAFKNRGKKRGA